MTEPTDEPLDHVRKQVVSTAARLAIALAPNEVDAVVAKTKPSRSALQRVRETPGLEVEPALTFVPGRVTEPE